MAYKFHSIVVTMAIISEITNTRKVEMRMLNDIHMKLVNLNKRIKKFYVSNTNMRVSHPFKEGIHVV